MRDGDQPGFPGEENGKILPVRGNRAGRDNPFQKQSSSSFAAADVAGTTSLKSAQGGIITVAQADGAVKINDAKVARADLLAKNGVIHVVDKVILPPEA